MLYLKKKTKTNKKGSAMATLTWKHKQQTGKNK